MSDQPVGKETARIETGSPPLQGERLAFTGTLASMTHRQAAELTEQHGGAATSDVSRQTTMLVVGEEGWPLESDGQPSLKWQHANELVQEGLPLRILNESDWLYLLGLEERTRRLSGGCGERIGEPARRHREPKFWRVRGETE